MQRRHAASPWQRHFQCRCQLQQQVLLRRRCGQLHADGQPCMLTARVHRQRQGNGGRAHDVVRQGVLHRGAQQLFCEVVDAHVVATQVVAAPGLGNVRRGGAKPDVVLREIGTQLTPHGVERGHRGHELCGFHLPRVLADLPGHGLQRVGADGQPGALRVAGQAQVEAEEPDVHHAVQRGQAQRRGVGLFDVVAHAGQQMRGALHGGGHLGVWRQAQQRGCAPADAQSRRVTARKFCVRQRRPRNQEGVAGLRHGQAVEHRGGVAHGLCLHEVLRQAVAVLVQQRRKGNAAA